MKIEVGKKYINANGLIVSITNKVEGNKYPYESVVSSYAQDGIYTYEKICGQDLICEVVPELHQDLINGIIIQREFIKKHIEYWTENEQTNL